MKNLINDVATEARALLNGILADCDTDDTTGTCLFASLLLARLAHSKGLSAVIRGGDGKSDGGLFTMYGGFGHYWCERSPTTMNSILLIYRQINLASKELSLRTSKR